MGQKRTRKILRILLPVLPILIFSIVMHAQNNNGAAAPAQSNQKQKKSPPATVPPPPQASDYVGAEACKVCHEDIYNGYEKTPHWKTMYNTQGGPAKQGCEGCHGPGKAHAESGDKTKIFTFKNVPADEISKRCLTCHVSGKEQMNFERAEHFKNGVSCIDCHSPHHSKDPEFLPRGKTA